MTIAEEAFQRDAAAISTQLAQPHVRDVWEERLPLALEAALSLGCVAAVSPAARSRPLAEGFDLVDLQVCGLPLLAQSGYMLLLASGMPRCVSLDMQGHLMTQAAGPQQRIAKIRRKGSGG